MDDINDNSDVPAESGDSIDGEVIDVVDGEATIDIDGSATAHVSDEAQAIQKEPDLANAEPEQQPNVSPTEANGTPIPAQSSVQTSEAMPGLPWAEKRAILKQIDDGRPITLEDFQKMHQPTSDLQAGTLEEDAGWVEQLLESERYQQAMHDSQAAGDLKEAILAALKARNYWRSKP
jgi:hypothetical protein